jgi:hypothetical protein
MFIDFDRKRPPSVRRAMFIDFDTEAGALRQEGHVYGFRYGSGGPPS